MRFKLGTVILFLPVALHFAARVTRRLSPVLKTPLGLKLALIFAAVGFLLLFIGVPLLAVFTQAFEKGVDDARERSLQVDLATGQPIS